MLIEHKQINCSRKREFDLQRRQGLISWRINGHIIGFIKRNVFISVSKTLFSFPSNPSTVTFAHFPCPFHFRPHSSLSLLACGRAYSQWGRLGGNLSLILSKLGLGVRLHRVCVPMGFRGSTTFNEMTSSIYLPPVSCERKTTRKDTCRLQQPSRVATLADYRIEQNRIEQNSNFIYPRGHFTKKWPSNEPCTLTSNT